MPRDGCAPHEQSAPTGCSSSANGTCDRYWVSTPAVTTATARTSPASNDHPTMTAKRARRWTRRSSGGRNTRSDAIHYYFEAVQAPTSRPGGNGRGHWPQPSPRSAGPYCGRAWPVRTTGLPNMPPNSGNRLLVFGCERSVSGTHRNLAAEGGGPAVAPEVTDGTGPAGRGSGSWRRSRSSQAWCVTRSWRSGRDRGGGMSRPATSTRATFAIGRARRAGFALPVLQSRPGEGLEGQPASVILTGARRGALPADGPAMIWSGTLTASSWRRASATPRSSPARTGSARRWRAARQRPCPGHEHYAGQLADLACAAVPIRPPGLWPADQ